MEFSCNKPFPLTRFLHTPPLHLLCAKPFPQPVGVSLYTARPGGRAKGTSSVNAIRKVYTYILRIHICNEAKRVYIYVMRVPPTRPPARARARKRKRVTRVPMLACCAERACNGYAVAYTPESVTRKRIRKRQSAEHQHLSSTYTPAFRSIRNA